MSHFNHIYHPYMMIFDDSRNTMIIYNFNIIETLLTVP